MLVYGKKEDWLEVIGYTNSNLARDMDERKSTGG